MPVGETAGHAVILLEAESTARTKRKHTGVLTKDSDRKGYFLNYFYTYYCVFCTKEIKTWRLFQM